MGETLKTAPQSPSPDKDPAKLNIDALDLPDSRVELDFGPSEAEDTKQQIESLPDAETRFKDIALLNGRERFKSTAHNMSINQVKRVGDFIRTKLQNLRDTPGLYKRGAALAVAEMRYNRHQAKMERLKNVAPEYKQRHIKKFERVERKYNKTKSEYDEHDGRMEARRNSVSENVETRRAEYVAELVSRKETALARRAARTELREQGIRRGEAKEIAKNIPAKHLKRAGRLAIAAEAAKRQGKKETRQARAAERSEERMESKQQRNQRLIEQYTQEAADADSRREEIIATTLPEADKHATELQAKLRGLDKNDPSYPGLEAQADQAAVAVDRLKSEIPRLERVAIRSRERAQALEAEQIGLSNQRDALKESLATLSEQQGATHEEHGRYSGQSRQAIRDILLTDDATEEHAKPATTGSIDSQDSPDKQPVNTEPSNEVASGGSSQEQSGEHETIATEAEHYLALRSLREAQREMAEARQTRNNAFDAYSNANTELTSPNAAFLPEQTKKDYSYHRDVLKDEFEDAQAAYDQKLAAVNERTEQVNNIEAALEKSRRKVAV